MFQTDGVPPNAGNTLLAMSGWIQKSKDALTKSVVANRSKRLVDFVGAII